jgi:hypothetical protein
LLLSTTYYVKNNGNDSADGLTIATAWQTINKINNLKILPGDNILFEGGQTFNGSIYLDANDANDNLNIVTISSYGNQQAIINSADNYGFYAYNTQGILLKDLVFTGSGTSTNFYNGVTFYADTAGDTKFSNITIYNLKINNYGGTGILIGSWNNNTGYNNVLIDRCIVSDILTNGINIWGNDQHTRNDYPHHNVSIKHTEVFNVTGYADSTIHKGSGIIIGQVDGGIIENCVAYNNGFWNTHCGGPGGIWAWECNNITIQYCESHHNSSGSGCDGIGFDFDGGVTNSIMQYNYSHDNDGAGYLLGQYQNANEWKNNVIRYNISENDGRTNGGGITLFKGPNTTMDSLKIYNNTVYITKSDKNFYDSFAAFSIAYWDIGINNVEVYNNIFQTKGVKLIDIPTGYNAFFAGNLYWSSGDTFKINYQGKIYNNLADWRTSTKNEVINTNPFGISKDPLLTNIGNSITIYPKPQEELTSYRLLKNSPAIDAGIDLDSLFNIKIGNRDFFNNLVPYGKSQDIGAFESNLEISIVENTIDENFVNYENPLNNGSNLHISATNDINSIEIINYLGETVLLQSGINSMNFIIPTNKLPKGAYFLSIKYNNNNILTKKLICY